MNEIEIKMIIDEYKAFQNRLKYNYVLFDIYEGQLLKYILEDVRKQVSEKTFASMEPRIVPINFLKKIVDKLSQIYTDEPTRTLTKESKDDSELFAYYMEKTAINSEMNLANEIFNLEKYVAIRPYVDNRKPALRIMQPDKFFVLSLNKSNPMRPTHYIEIMGKKEKADILHVYTDETFYIIDSDGNILVDDMMALDNPNGVNLLGKLPIAYIPKSKFDLIPREDSDLLKMVKILPILFSDLNEVVFWQSFSIIYGIDLSEENLTMAPNAFWSLKSDPATAQKPEVGTIKPQADIQSVMNFIMFQLDTWLSTRGIKSSSATATSGLSGFSKMVDEIDTTEDRKKQIPFFVKGETELWELIFNHYHPYWVQRNMIDETRLFTPDQSIKIEFKKQVPVVDTSKTLDEIQKEIDLRLTTRKRAIQKLNPKMDEAAIGELLVEIEKEDTIYVDEKKDPNKQEI